MTDYQEEQHNEIEALESIYPEELTVISEEPYHCFQMVINSQEIEYEGTSCQATCVLQFTYTEKYPEEALLVEVESFENLDDEQVEKILDLINEQMEENLGMAMVFTLVSAAMERMSELVEESIQQKEDEKERKKREHEEAERKKFEGTLVTIESFLAWKADFDAEIASKKGKVVVLKGPKVKLTGKELFMADSTLDDSDIKFLDDEGDSVKVDESLFQDMEDLELEEDDLS